MEFVLPLPPSVNRLWRNIGHRTILSREARVYRQTVKSILQCHRFEMLTGPLAVDILVFPPDRRRRDIDNFQKALLDSLQHAGAFVDDSQIERLSIERREVLAKGSVVVRIEPIAVPTPSLSIAKRANKRNSRLKKSSSFAALD